MAATAAAFSVALCPHDWGHCRYDGAAGQRRRRHASVSRLQGTTSCLLRLHFTAPSCRYPFPLTGPYTTAADITSPILDGGLTLLMHKGTYSPPPLGFLRPFSWQASTPDSVQTSGQQMQPPRQMQCSRTLRGTWCVQVWCAIIAALLAVTLAYHMLRYASPFGDYSRIRMRQTNEPPGRVRSFIVASCETQPLMCLP